MVYRDPSRANVCSGETVEFYWINYREGKTQEEHIDYAVERLMEAVSGGRRVWPPKLAIWTRANFKERLKAACRGELDPPQEIKPIHGKLKAIYEIRWDHVSVHEKATDSEPARRRDDVHVRLLFAEPDTLFAEPDALGACCVALHAHEKDVSGSPEEIAAKQNEHIALAEDLHEQALRDRSWGVHVRS